MEEDIVVVVADYDAAQQSSEHVGVEHVAADVEEAEEPLPEIHYHYDDATMMTTLSTLQMLLSYYPSQ